MFYEDQVIPVSICIRYISGMPIMHMALCPLVLYKYDIHSKAPTSAIREVMSINNHTATRQKVFSGRTEIKHHRGSELERAFPVGQSEKASRWRRQHLGSALKKKGQFKNIQNVVIRGGLG